MKDFEYYSTNPIKYPNKIDYTKTYIYNEGKVLDKIWGEVDLTEYPKESVVQRILDTKAYYKEVDEYNKEKKRLYNEFKKDLFEEFGVEDNPKKNRAFEIAWDRGNTEGFYSVYNHFVEIIELIM